MLLVEFKKEGGREYFLALELISPIYYYLIAFKFNMLNFFENADAPSFC